MRSWKKKPKYLEKKKGDLESEIANTTDSEKLIELSTNYSETETRLDEVTLRWLELNE